MIEITKKETNFVGYEYRDVAVRASMKSVVANGYSNFGWVLEGTTSSVNSIVDVVLKFKRGSKITHKAELTRLQRQFDGCVADIQTLERTKASTAQAIAFTIGVIGTAFILGAVFALITNLLALSFILAIPGFIVWIIPYFCYHFILKIKIDRVIPLIEQKYEEIYQVCEKAKRLLNK